MLELQSVRSGYGSATVLFDVSLRVGAGEVVALLGRNGMGKTTTVRTIMGLVPPQAGRVHVGGVDVTGFAPNRIARLGIGLVPEGRQVFPNLTVEENLLATHRRPEAAAGGWTLDSVYGLFPALRSRRGNMGNQLSGGEQQMLAIGRALLTNPSLVILDEATEGLAPLIRQEIWRILRELRATGLSILIIDKNLEALSSLCDRGYVMAKGRVVWEGAPRELASDAALQAKLLGLA